MAGATLNVSIHNGPNQLVYKKIEYLEFVKMCVRVCPLWCLAKLVLDNTNLFYLWMLIVCNFRHQHNL